MKLYGRYLSPFVRRVGTSLNLLGIPFEQVVLSVVADKETIRKVNPLVRVPALELGDGEILIESGAILDALDEMAGLERRLIPFEGKARRNVLQLVALATGGCDKVVGAYYERTRRPKEFHWSDWAEHCESQARGAFEDLDRVAAEAQGFLYGSRMTQADVSAVCAFDFAKTTLPETVGREDLFPHLAAHSRRLNALEAFSSTYPVNT